MHYDAEQGPLTPDEWLNLAEVTRANLVRDHHLDPEESHPQAGSREMHVVVHVVVENQLAMNDPSEAREALVRLREEGLSRHEAIHAIGSRLTNALHGTLTASKPFDLERYRKDLSELTADSWFAEYEEDSEPVEKQARPGRNEPCWCGSGEKYKRCHMETDSRET